MAWRAAAWRARSGLPDWPPAALAVGAGIATALGESVYYWIKLGISPDMVLAANLDFAAGPRPAWIVVAICLGVGLAGLLRNRLPSAVRRNIPERG
jgi:hypothetical protein